MILHCRKNFKFATYCSAIFQQWIVQVALAALGIVTAGCVSASSSKEHLSLNKSSSSRAKLNSQCLSSSHALCVQPHVFTIAIEKISLFSSKTIVYTSIHNEDAYPIRIQTGSMHDLVVQAVITTKDSRRFAFRLTGASDPPSSDELAYSSVIPSGGTMELEISVPSPMVQQDNVTTNMWAFMQNIDLQSEAVAVHVHGDVGWCRSDYWNKSYLPMQGNGTVTVLACR